MKRKSFVVCCSACLAVLQLVSNISAAPTDPVPTTTFPKLPIREITAFKDGHAVVAHEGELPTDAQGNVVMDYLPVPVIGTFWPYSTDPRARLTAVTAGQRLVTIDRTAITLRELLMGNVGSEVIVTEMGGGQYAGTIREIPRRSGAELNATSASNMPERMTENGNVLLLETKEGLRTISIDRVQDVTFKGDHNNKTTIEEFRNLLTLKLDWGRSTPAKSAKVGLFYVQKGVRWIPSYRVEIDGKGKAVVKMQATLINELADLDDVSVNLVVGVPTFTFKDTIDPMALQQNLAQLSPYFQTDMGGRNGLFASQFSNALMSQAARSSEYVPTSGGATGGNLGPEIGDAGKTEDQFVYTVKHVTLRKGERMIVPVTEFTVPYRDVFALDIPVAPPQEIRASFGSDQQRDLARLLRGLKVMHEIRLTNSSAYPFTTAPALIIRDNRVLAQGMMTYTSIGATADLAVTAALDFQVNKSERESKRTPNALIENGNQYSRVDLAGKVSITSHRSDIAEIEVRRFVFGTVDSANQDARIEMINPLEDGDFQSGSGYPGWWGWYGWPYWWNYQNGVAQITWKVKVDAKQPFELNYEWHYFWR